MNDKELADAVVALGVGQDIRFGLGEANVEKFVRDWRVAGALMEKCESVNIINAGNGKFSALVHLDRGVEHQMAMSDSKARAITEACVQALTDSQ